MIKDFEYFALKTLKEALTLLDKYRGECKIIAGGQSLLVLMRQRLVAPEYLIDIKGVSELNYIKSDAKEGLKIGALATHRAVEKSPAMKNGFSVLGEMERRLAKEVRVITEAGAYTGMGATALYLTGFFSSFPYKYPNYRYDGYRVYTNTEPTSSATLISETGGFTWLTVQKGGYHTLISLDRR